VLNGGIISKQWIGQDVEGSGPGQISDTVMVFASWTVEGHYRPIGTASMRAEILIWDFPYINLEFQLFMSCVQFLSKVIPVEIAYCCRPLPKMF
jgi:hypothetical protein